MLKGRFWKNLDWPLLLVALLLSVIGILVIYSITFKAANLPAQVEPLNQISFFILGIIGLFAAAIIDYRVWTRFTTWLYLASLALLGYVAVAGHTALGATRWINLGFFQFQPSEISKIVLIVVLAKFFATHYEHMNKVRNLLLSLVYMLVPTIFVLAQPDLGTALVFMVIWLAMVLATRVPKSYIVGLIGVGLALMPVFISLLRPYQRQRLATFLNPMGDPLGTGYNVVQSTITVGSGQLYGRGLAAGSQSQLNFLPSQHTDFIFAVLAEKLGFIGGTILLTLFLVLLVRGLVVAWRARERFGMFIAIGLVAMLGFHFFINIGMNMGMMPVTGIPLPFVSYGGTSMLVSLVAVGLLESIAVRRKKIHFGT